MAQEKSNNNNNLDDSDAKRLAISTMFGASVALLQAGGDTKAPIGTQLKWLTMFAGSTTLLYYLVKWGTRIVLEKKQQQK